MAARTPSRTLRTAAPPIGPSCRSTARRSGPCTSSMANQTVSVPRRRSSSRVEHGDEVGVVEVGEVLRLPAQPLPLHAAGADDLDGDLALEPFVPGAVDRPHPTGPDLGSEAIAAAEHRDRLHPTTLCADPASEGSATPAQPDRTNTTRPRIHARIRGPGGQPLWCDSRQTRSNGRRQAYGAISWWIAFGSPAADRVGAHGGRVVQQRLR